MESNSRAQLCDNTMDITIKVFFFLGGGGGNSKSETRTDFPLRSSYIFCRFMIRTRLRTFDVGSFINGKNVTPVM